MTEQDKESLIEGNLVDEEIDLMSIFKTLWEGKGFIISITSFAAIFSVVVSLLLTNMYRSESILMARTSQDSGALSQYAGVASLAGISLPTAGGDSSIEVMQIIRSREFVRHLITFEDVLPSLMAVEAYNQTTQELSFNPEIYDDETKTWITSPSSGKKQPSYLDAHEVYVNMMAISQDIKTSLISISVEHISPFFAKEFLELIIEEANTLKREKDISTSNKALNYLKEELSQTALAPIKESINLLIEAQLETRMMAKIHEEYSLVVIEPPFIPEQRFFPVRSIISILGTLFGGMISVVIVLAQHYLRQKNKKNI